MSDLDYQSLFDRFGQVTERQRDNAEEIRCVVSDLASEFSRLTARGAAMELERNDWKLAFGVEFAKQLRLEFGARPDETFSVFVQRLVAERDDARDIVDGLQSIAHGMQIDFDTWKNKYKASKAFSEGVTQENTILRNKLTQANCELAQQSARQIENQEVSLWKAKFAESQRQVNELHSELIVLRRELDNDDREFADVYAAASAQVNGLTEKLKQSQSELEELRVNIVGALSVLDPNGQGDDYAMSRLKALLAMEDQIKSAVSEQFGLRNGLDEMLCLEGLEDAGCINDADRLAEVRALIHSVRQLRTERNTAEDIRDVLLMRESRTCTTCSRSVRSHSAMDPDVSGILWCDEVNNACAAMGNRCGMWNPQPESEGV
jgi:hypothetical protein